MTESSEMQTQLVSAHGMLAILEVLEGKCSRDVTMKLLQIINLVSRGSLIECCRSTEPSFPARYSRPGLLGELLSNWVSDRHSICDSD